MQTIFNLITIFLLTTILLLEIFPFLKFPKKVAKETIHKKVETYTLTLVANDEVLNYLLNGNFSFSYFDGKIYLTLHSKEDLRKLLNLYHKEKRKLKKIKLASAAVVPLIGKDIENVQTRIEELSQNYERLKTILENQKMVPDFTQLEPLIVEKQKETFEGFTKYWDLKVEQILSGFKNPVKEPEIYTTDLENKALQFFGNELQAKLFAIYLQLKILESRLEADTYKLKEYGG